MRIIFHLPMKIDKNRPSGSQIRPMKMLQAFENIGYEVDVVIGDVNTRKKQINQIRQNILNGVKYDFLYSESSTMPTVLTETHHLPVAPFLDFNFFKFCKKHNIKIGLFYRDIFWKFKDKNSFKHKKDYLKYVFSTIFYKFDLRQYGKLVDILYLPSKKMFNYIDIRFDENKVIDLPPGIEKKDNKEKEISKKLSFVYIGGLSKLYDLTLFTKTLSNMNNIEFNLCTRKKEWEENKKFYNYTFLNVYHLSGKELENIYNKSDIAIYFVKPHFIWEFAMGLKLFEYISFLKPIIAIKGTAVGDFVEKNNIGWVIDFDENILKNLIEFLQNNPNEIIEKKDNIKKIIDNNTWEARTLQVVKSLRG